MEIFGKKHDKSPEAMKEKVADVTHEVENPMPETDKVAQTRNDNAKFANSQNTDGKAEPSKEYRDPAFIRNSAAQK